MRKQIADLVFQGVIIGVVGIGVIQALGWKYETALLPYTIGVVVLVLAAANLARELAMVLRGRKAAMLPPADETQASVFATDSVTGKSLIEIVWLVGYTALIWLTGFYPASFIYLGLFFRRRAGLNLVWSLAGAAATTGAIYVVFRLLFKIPVYKGLMDIWF